MHLRILCNLTHQELRHSQFAGMMEIQDMPHLTATGFMKANIAKAHHQGRKGCSSKYSSTEVNKSCN